jgi:ankyrin repeat protein
VASPLFQDDRTPLHYACTCGSLVVTASILEKNSNKAFMDMQDRYGDTALHIASRHGYTEVVKELLSHRANKDIVNQVC